MAGSGGEMDYRGLITRFVQDNLTVPALQFIHDDPMGVQINLIPDGIINYVFRVKSRDEKQSVIIKYFQNQVKDEPEIKIPLKRQQLEYDGMLLMDSIEPGSVPTPFCLDTTHKMIAMRDLGDCEMLLHQVYGKKELNLGVAAHLGKLLGMVHTQTSKDNVSQQQWEELKSKFKHDDLKDFLAEQHHEIHYDEHAPGNNIPEEFSASYNILVNDIKQQGLDTKVLSTVKEDLCFIHADCHHGNIFVKDGKNVLIDFETAYLGHPAENVAIPIQGYVFTYIIGEARQSQNDISTSSLKAKCKTAIRTLLEAYLQHRTDLKNNESNLKEFFSSLTLLTGSVVFFMGGRLFDTMSGCPGMDRSDRGRLMIHAHKLMTNHHKVATLVEFMDLV